MGRDDRWGHLVQAAFLLEQGAADPGRRRRAAELITSALEVFPPGIDPVEDFEGYAVRRLLLALQSSLDAP